MGKGSDGTLPGRVKAASNKEISRGAARHDIKYGLNLLIREGEGKEGPTIRGRFPSACSSVS